MRKREGWDGVQLVAKNQKLDIPHSTGADQVFCCGQTNLPLSCTTVVTTYSSAVSAKFLWKPVSEENPENVSREEWAGLTGSAVHCQLLLGDRGLTCRAVHRGRLPATLCCCGLVPCQLCFSLAHLCSLLVSNESSQDQECTWWAELGNGLNSLNRAYYVLNNAISITSQKKTERKTMKQPCPVDKPFCGIERIESTYKPQIGVIKFGSN